MTLGKLPVNERSPDDGMSAFNKLIAQMQETTPKTHSVINSAPTEQDILANLLGKQMKLDAHHTQPHHTGKLKRNSYFWFDSTRNPIYFSSTSRATHAGRCVI